MAKFAKNFPKSPLVPAAVLYEARAAFYSNQFGMTLNLLSANQSRTNPLADQYLYWTGRAHFENTNYTAAANAFARLTGTFTNSPLRLDATIREAAYAREVGRLARHGVVAAGDQWCVSTDPALRHQQRNDSSRTPVAGRSAVGAEQIQRRGGSTAIIERIDAEGFELEPFVPAGPMGARARLYSARP